MEPRQIYALLRLHVYLVCSVRDSLELSEVVHDLPFPFDGFSEIHEEQTRRLSSALESMEKYIENLKAQGVL
jgi:predicted urease superfamily metal-dependent hydrolase